MHGGVVPGRVLSGGEAVVAAEAGKKARELIQKPRVRGGRQQ